MAEILGCGRCGFDNENFTISHNTRYSQEEIDRALGRWCRCNPASNNCQLAKRLKELGYLRSTEPTN